MPRVPRTVWVSVLVLLSGAAWLSKPAGSAPPPPRIEAPAAPVAAPKAQLPEPLELAYGPHPAQKLDLWVAKSERPSPLLVFIHGGGFVGGDKAEIRKLDQSVARWLAAGVSVASINYRFRNEAPVQDILRDCARAVQFLRATAPAHHLDRARVVAWGGSAGGGAALWLAFHDDLADAMNKDPVLRESSRVAGAAAFDAQFSYDLLQWAEVLGAPPDVLAPGGLHHFYGLARAEDLRSAQGQRARADVDVRAWISRDDPPVFLSSSSEDKPPTNLGELTHHPRHTLALEKRCQEKGVEVTVELTHPSAKRTPRVSFVEYVAGRLGVEGSHAK